MLFGPNRDDDIAQVFVTRKPIDDDGLKDPGELAGVLLQLGQPVARHEQRRGPGDVLGAEMIDIDRMTDALYRLKPAEVPEGICVLIRDVPGRPPGGRDLDAAAQDRRAATAGRRATSR